jgi:hypothetical protein
VQRSVDEWREEVEDVVTGREARVGVEDVLMHTLSEEDGVGEAHRQSDTAREEASSS